MSHRRAVRLHEQVVDEVDAEIDVLQARELFAPLRLGVTRAQEIHGIERRLPPGQLRPQVGREDLLPAVMALEGRQVSGAHEALGLVIEARPRGRGGQALDDGSGNSRKPTDAGSEQVGRVRVVAAEELVAALTGEGDLDVTRSEL